MGNKGVKLLSVLGKAIRCMSVKRFFFIIVVVLPTLLSTLHSLHRFLGNIYILLSFTELKHPFLVDKIAQNSTCSHIEEKVHVAEVEGIYQSVFSSYFFLFFSFSFCLPLSFLINRRNFINNGRKKGEKGRWLGWIY